eukprot:TRINITY_DN5502_c1_g1_i1.p1 TRINITY_DN5502_c1_g1~~TRINITY_DN5502_c1_g1_i1.p1  ORF type:complete len:232 (-),score=47.02 TRINITY_DN5502_c1_g1_i1:185-880(-)
MDDLGSRELGLLVDAIPAVRSSLLPQLQTRAATTLTMLSAAVRALDGGTAESLQDCAYSLGAFGTFELLDKAGFDVSVGPICRELAPESTEMEFGIGSVLCVADYEVQMPQGQEKSESELSLPSLPLKGQLRRWNRGSSGGKMSKIQMPLQALTLTGRSVDREACAEFRALAALTRLLPETGVNGSVRLSVSEPPCLSCAAAMLQFSRHFSHIRLHVRIDGTLLRFSRLTK